MNIIKGSGEFCWTDQTHVGLFPTRKGIREYRYSNMRGYAVVQGDIVVGTVAEIQRQTFPYYLKRLSDLSTDASKYQSSEVREALHLLAATALQYRLREMAMDLRAFDAIELSGELRGAIELLVKATDGPSLAEVLPLGLTNFVGAHPFGNIVHGSTYAWPNARVPYIIDEAFNDGDRPAVQQGIQEWNDTGIVSLVGKTDADQNYIRFLSDPQVSNSSLGMQGDGEQQIRLKINGISHGSVLHEVGHALGLDHEHCRTDRDTYVYVYYPNIIPDQVHNFDISGDAENAYDYGSIMHYPNNAFALDPGYLTLAPKQDGVVIGQRDKLSDGELAAARIMYPGSSLRRSHGVRRSQVIVNRSPKVTKRAAQAVAGAAPQCPGTTGIDTNVQLVSNHQYSITNDGDDDILVTITATLSDSRGNQNSEAQNNVVVGAHSTDSTTLQVFLVAAYNPSGIVTVTASTTVSGGATASASGHCSFQVVGVQQERVSYSANS